MSRSWPGICLVAAVVAAQAVAAGAPQRDTREQQVVVSVLDRDGAPSSGLTAADFVIREDGIAREVVRVEQASAPVQIVVLVDTSHDMQVILQDVRIALRAFASRIWAESPESDISLMEFGERPALVAPPTTSPEVLGRAIDRLFEHPGSGGYLLEALNEATKLLGSRQTPRPVVVVFAREGTEEFSNLRFETLEAAVKESGASLWALVLQDSRPAQPTNETRQRDIVLGDVTARSGGTRDILLNRTGIEPKFQQLAERLTAQYVVTYGRPDSLIPPSRIEVSVKRPGARVLASRWADQ